MNENIFRGKGYGKSLLKKISIWKISNGNEFQDHMSIPINKNWLE